MSWIKFSIVTFFAILSANLIILTSTEFIKDLINPTLDGLKYIIVFWIVCSLFISLLSLLLISTYNKVLMGVFYSCLLLTLFINFAININGNQIAISIINTLLIAIGIIHMHTKFWKEIANQIKQDPKSILHGVGVFTLLIGIAISLSFYSLNSQNSEQFNLYDKTRNYVLETTSYYSRNTTKNLVSSMIGDNFSLPMNIAPEINTENTQEMIQSKVSDQVTQKVDTLLIKYEPYLIPFYTGLIFLSIISLSPFIRYLSYLITLIIFQILKRTHFLHEENETIDVIRYKL